MKKRHLLSQTLTLITRSLSSSTSTFSVKKVTKSNFDSAFEKLKIHVKNADFVSVDLEMTGITSAPWRESFDFDRFDVQYLKVKDSAEKFAVVQLGVCPFRWDSSNQSFVAHPHTFYIFPRTELPFDGPAHEFLCQTASLDFLARYQFDFNACFYEGISYLSRTQEGEALKNLNLAYEDNLSNSDYHLKEVKDIQLVSIADILFTERIKNKFSQWRDGLLRNTRGGSQFEGNSIDSKPQMQIVFFHMRPALKLSGFTSHQLRLVHLVTKRHFKDLAYVNVKGENSPEQKLVVYTDSDGDKDVLMKEVKKAQLKEAEVKVNAAVGIRHVIDLLSTEQKLVVGHNSFLDMVHMYNKFFGPLPSTVEEFASRLHKSFPYIIDTKYILNNDLVIQNIMNKKSRSLSSAFSFLCPEIASVSTGPGLVRRSQVKVEVRVDEMSSSNWNSGAKHEAGYDAFMTGCVFAQACSHIGVDFQLLLPLTVLAQNEKLQKYINILYTSWNSGAIIDLSTGDRSFESSGYHRVKQRYPKVEFENIVLLWGFLPKYKPGELKECLVKTFGLTAVTHIYYLDGTAAFIQFNKKELVHDFLALKEILEQRNDAISILHPLSKLLEGGRTGAADYETYKEICSSSISRLLFADQAEAVSLKRKNKEVEASKAMETAELNTREVESSGGAEQSLRNFVTKSAGKRTYDRTTDQSCNSFSSADLVDALCGAESKFSKTTKTSSS